VDAGTLMAERSEAPDASLAGRADDARAAAFRRLVDGELDRAYRLAAVILGDPVEAEDAVHDAAVSAWRRWSQLRDESRFEAWFGRILVNTCRDRLRLRRRRALFELGRGLSPPEHPAVADTGIRAAERDGLRRAFQSLSPDERIVLVLRYEADLTVSSIASHVGVPEGTVKSRLHNSLGKLRRSLDEADR
jgi:RNA polymerase sigma-70 factor, ECF subfamily